MDASRHGPKKGGPMGSTIGPFKYYVIHYQTLFKYFRAAGLPGQTGRPGPIKSILGCAWAVTSAHGQARHVPLIFPCLNGPVLGRAGPTVWPPIQAGKKGGRVPLQLTESIVDAQFQSNVHNCTEGWTVFYLPSTPAPRSLLRLPTTLGSPNAAAS